MDAWEDSKTDGILEGWLTKESHDIISVFRKWELRFFVLNFRTKTLSYYTDNTYANQRGSYILSDISVVNVNYIRNPKKPMLELTGTSRGSVQRLYLVTPTVQTITLWYVSLRHVVRGEDPRVRVMSNWTATLSAIINVSCVWCFHDELCLVCCGLIDVVVILHLHLHLFTV